MRISLNHQEPDRLPIDFGAMVDGINAIAYNRLKKYLGMKYRNKGLIYISNWQKPEEAIRRLWVQMLSSCIDTGGFRIDIANWKPGS